MDKDIWFDGSFFWVIENLRDGIRCSAKVSFLQHPGWVHWSDTRWATIQRSSSRTLCSTPHTGGNYLLGGFRRKRYSTLAAFSSKIVVALLLTQLEDDRFLSAAAGLRNDMDTWWSKVAGTPDFAWIRIAELLELQPLDLRHGALCSSVVHSDQ